VDKRLALPVSESIILHFSYKGLPQEIECSLRVSTYTYQFLCTAGEAEIILEKDDGGRLRAREADPFSNKMNKPDPGLVLALMNELERVLQ
jgi:hypothetical protein